ncbi:MAG: 30S ribosome-binding factor RbfA [Bacilli bacterium]
MSMKVNRVEQVIKREVSSIIQRDLKDNKIGFITITDVKLTNDLSIATIYVNFLGSENRNEAGLKTLERSKGFIKSKLAQRLTIRKTPNLIFKIDTSLEQGNKINALLKQIKE